MAKEKVKKDKPKDREVYYEVIGLVMIFLAVIILAGVGKIGLGLKLLCRVVVGDWYFGFLITALVSGILLIVKKEKYNFYTIRYSGIFLLLLSLMLLAHSSFYHFSLAYGDNSLTGMWNIYAIYIKNYKEEYIMGGGLIGGFVYQILYFLFGDVGSFLVIILILFFAIIFITNNNLFSFYRLSKIYYKKAVTYAKTIYGYIRKIERVEKKVAKKSLLMLSEPMPVINLNLQQKVNDDLVYGIKNLFFLMKVNITSITATASYLFSIIIIEVNTLNNIDVKARLKEIITGVFYLVIEKNIIKIEIENRFKDLLPLKKILSDIDSTSRIPIGMSYDNKITYFDPDSNHHMLISGGMNCGIRTFIKSFISTIILKSKRINLYILDLRQEYKELSLYQYYDNIGNLEVIFTSLSNEIEKRMDILKYLGVNSISSANKAIEEKKLDCEKIENIYFILNGLDIAYESINAQSYEGKLIYLAQLGGKVGIHLIIINRSNGVVTSLLKSSFTFRLAFKVNNIGQSLEMLGNDHAIYLVGKGDYVLSYLENEDRIQAGFITDIEYRNILK